VEILCQPGNTSIGRQNLPVPSVRMAQLSSITLVLLYFTIRHYLAMSVRANHLYVNVHILHHHLVGKLEVGFCDHLEPCHCVENFCSYVLKNYKISLLTDHRVMILRHKGNLVYLL